MSVLQAQKFVLKAKLFRGLGDPTRLSILEASREGEKPAYQIVRATGQSQSNISNHLACLMDCGLGKERSYFLSLAQDVWCATAYLE